MPSLALISGQTEKVAECQSHLASLKFETPDIHHLARNLSGASAALVPAWQTELGRIGPGFAQLDGTNPEAGAPVWAAESSTRPSGLVQNQGAGVSTVGATQRGPVRGTIPSNVHRRQSFGEILSRFQTQAGALSLWGNWKMQQEGDGAGEVQEPRPQAKLPGPGTSAFAQGSGGGGGHMGSGTPGLRWGPQFLIGRGSASVVG